MQKTARQLIATVISLGVVGLNFAPAFAQARRSTHHFVGVPTNPSGFDLRFQQDLDRIAKAAEVANSKSPPPRDDSPQRSAAAEEWAAKFALAMVIVAAIETAVTALGVYLVGKALGASRDAATEAQRAANEAKRQADAAEKSIKVTRNIGRAQVRAYLNVETVDISFFEEWRASLKSPSSSRITVRVPPGISLGTPPSGICIWNTGSLPILFRHSQQTSGPRPTLFLLP